MIEVLWSRTGSALGDQPSGRNRVRLVVLGSVTRQGHFQGSNPCSTQSGRAVWGGIGVEMTTPLVRQECNPAGLAHIIGPCYYYPTPSQVCLILQHLQILPISINGYKFDLSLHGAPSSSSSTNLITASLLSR